MELRLLSCGDVLHTAAWVASRIVLDAGAHCPRSRTAGAGLCGAWLGLPVLPCVAVLATRTGLFKGNLTALVGSLFPKSERDAAYGRFYWAVNLSALPSGVAGAWLLSHHGFRRRFWSAALRCRLSSSSGFGRDPSFKGVTKSARSQPTTSHRNATASPRFWVCFPWRWSFLCFLSEWFLSHSVRQEQHARHAAGNHDCAASLSKLAVRAGSGPDANLESPVPTLAHLHPETSSSSEWDCVRSPVWSCRMRQCWRCMGAITIASVPLAHQQLHPNLSQNCACLRSDSPSSASSLRPSLPDSDGSVDGRDCAWESGDRILGNPLNAGRMMCSFSARLALLRARFPLLWTQRRRLDRVLGPP